MHKDITNAFEVRFQTQLISVYIKANFMLVVALGNAAKQLSPFAPYLNSGRARSLSRFQAK